MRSSEKVRRAVLNQPGSSLILSIPSSGAPGLAWEMLLGACGVHKGVGRRGSHRWEGARGQFVTQRVSLLCPAPCPAQGPGWEGRRVVVAPPAHPAELEAGKGHRDAHLRTHIPCASLWLLTQAPCCVIFF